LESIATAKRAWGEQLKSKLNSVLRQSKKPLIRQKKEKAKAKEPEPQVVNADGEIEQISTSANTTQQPVSHVKENQYFGIPSSELPFVFDSNSLLDAILKINTINYAGNLMLSWGSIKL